MNKNNNFSLIYFILGILLYGSGFSNIFRLCGSASWLVVLFGSVISTSLFFLYKKILSNKFIKFINISLLLLINIMILRIFTTSFYLTKTPGIVITIPFILLCLYNSNKGINVITKETNILFILSFIVILINMLAASKTGSISYIFDISNIKSTNIIKGIIYYVLYVLSPFILLSNINIDNKTYFKSFIFTNLFMLFICIAIIYVLGPKLISIYRFPEYMIFKEIHLFGFIENVENLVGLIYFLNLFITSSLCLYNINTLYKNKYIKYFIIFVIIIITEIVSDKYKYSYTIYKYLPHTIIIIIFLYLVSYLLKKE